MLASYTLLFEIGPLNPFGRGSLGEIDAVAVRGILARRFEEVP